MPLDYSKWDNIEVSAEGMPKWRLSRAASACVDGTNLCRGVTGTLPLS